MGELVVEAGLVVPHALGVKHVPALPLLVLAVQHRGHRSSLLLHQGTRHPEVNVKLPVLPELALAVNHRILDAEGSEGGYQGD